LPDLPPDYVPPIRPHSVLGSTAHVHRPEKNFHLSVNKTLHWHHLWYLYWNSGSHRERNKNTMKHKAILTEKNGKKTAKRTKINLGDEFKNNPNLETIEIAGLFFERSQFKTLCLNTAHLRRG